MATHYETEPNGEKALVIDGFDSGIADSPYSGINSLTQVNISVPGEISVGYPITTSTISSGTLGNPIHRATEFLKGNAVAYYILTTVSGAESLVFKSSNGFITSSWSAITSGNTNTGGNATNQGLAFWVVGSVDGYLFKFRDSHIDYLDPVNGTWVSNWNPADGSTTASAVIKSGVSHFALVGQDNVLYFCNGSGVGAIRQNIGSVFDPTDTATFTFNGMPTQPDAVVLPAYDSSQCLAEQATNLLIGGSQNAIYPWDRQSIGFSYPLFVADSFIKRMVTANTNVYIFTGNLSGRGRIYVSNGSNANLFYKIPDYLFGESDPYYQWGDAIWHRNNLIFGFFVVHNAGGTGGSQYIASQEVWAVDLGVNQYGTATESGFRSISTLPLLGTTHGNATVLIPDGSNDFSSGMSYVVAWQNGATNPGLGYAGTTAGFGSYAMATDLLNVGTLYQVKTFTQVEFKLRSPLASGESITLLASTDTGFTTLGTTNTTGAISDVYPVSFEKAQWLRILVSATGNSANSGVRLEEIRLR